MSFEIEIIEGHDPSSYFWFYPVKVKKEKRICFIDIEKLRDEISIEETDVDCFLAHFLLKYFDKTLPVNQERVDCYSDEGEYDEDEVEYLEGFEWYLEHNFFTYDSIRLMLKDIEWTADILSQDYHSEQIEPITSTYSKYHVNIYSQDESNADSIVDAQSVEENAHIVIDFYKRFVVRVNKMLQNNPDTDLFCIQGP